MTSKMPFIAIGYGSILIAIGVVGYFATGQSSITALIPAMFGFVAELCGVLARNDRFLKPAMHGAALVGLLGIFGTMRVVPQIPGLFDGTAERPAAILAQGLTLLVSVIFVALCVRSFVEARKAREAEALR